MYVTQGWLNLIPAPQAPEFLSIFRFESNRPNTDKHLPQLIILESAEATLNSIEAP